MSRISVDVSSARIPVLQVGYQGENEVTDVLFDISSWIAEFGEGVAQLRVKRPGNSEEESYVLRLTITDGIALWTVSETDTFNKGNGKVQLSYLVGNIVKKAVIYPYKVGKSIVGADNPVDPFDSWIERSKAWAIGETLYGDAVPETDETYQNNAKYYVVLATEKAGAAAESEANAAASEAAVNGVSTQITTRMSAIETEQSVQSARMDTFTSLPEGSTSGNAELADIRVGADGITYDTAGNAVRGQIIDLKSDLSQIPTHFEYITVTQQHGKRWQYSDNFNLIDAAGYYACDFSAEENQEYTIRARNVGTNTTFAIAFFNGNTLIHSITDVPTTDNHTVVVKAPTGCNSIRFTTNNNSNPYVLVKKKALGKLDAVYVALSGSDDHTGEKSHPFQTIAKAVDSNLSDTIVVANGRYQAPISISDRKKLHLIGALDGTTVIDYTTTITPITGSSGVKEVAFSSIESDAIYKVFVSKELQISQTGNATAYTVNLWSFDGLTLMIPKETLAEVQSTENTWTYDGSKIYVNGTGSDYKLVNSYEDNGAYFSNIQELTLENINVRYSGYNNCKIENCNNIKVIGCDFSNSGRQHGMTIDNSNGTIEKCTAFRNCYDGFNIHNKGNTVFIDCESGYNRDDGLSHHDGATGTVIGGKYHHNYKGGISPTYDAKVDIYNALCSSNGYGIYYSTVSEPTECIISGCSLVGNNAYGLRVVGYNITSIGTIYADNNSNSKADGGGSIYNLGGN